MGVVAARVASKQRCVLCVSVCVCVLSVEAATKVYRENEELINQTDKAEAEKPH